MLGIIAALLLFDSVRRIGFPRPVGLFPAVVLLLSGYFVILEHAVLTDSSFIFLVSLSLWLTVPAWRGTAWWAMAAGLCLGMATDDRTVGLELLPVALLALALLPRARSSAGWGRANHATRQAGWLGYSAIIRSWQRELARAAQVSSDACSRLCRF